MQKIFLALFISLLLLPVLQGCVTIKQKPESIYYGLDRKYAYFNPAHFEKEIRRLKLITYNDAASEKHANAYLSLAMIYLAHNNPQMNYSRARKAIEQYVAIEPGAVKLHNLQNWMKVLKKIEKDKTSKESLHKKSLSKRVSPSKSFTEKKGEVKRLQGENKRLYSEIGNLENMVNKLRSDIEKLSELDLELEKKRKINR